MTAVTRPRGPLPARVYWTRRLLLRRGRVRAGLRDRAAARQRRLRQPEAQPVGADAVQHGTPAHALADPAGHHRRRPPPSTGAGAQGRRPATPTPTPLASPTAPAPTATSSRPRRSRARRTPAARSCFTMTLTTRCPHRPAPGTSPRRSMVVKVTSGSDRIWSSQECPARSRSSRWSSARTTPVDGLASPGTASAPTATAPGRRRGPSPATTTWSRRRSGPSPSTCSSSSSRRCRGRSPPRRRRPRTRRPPAAAARRRRRRRSRAESQT